ncbi:MAG TPA: hypothetical protein VM490_26390 [Armatimonadaceae bacterium]|jgi:hypothetical protein|nr:hypothetical protein [Armatimonadaceae bacterium]
MPRAPLREEVAERLRALLAGDDGEGAARSDASAWAREWILEDDPDTRDRAVWRALVRLVGVTLRHDDGTFADGPETVREWLNDLESAPRG